VRPELHSCVALEIDLPEFYMQRGDIGVVVELYPGPVLMVEFMDDEGDTVALLDLDDEDVRIVDDWEARNGPRSKSPLKGAKAPIADATRSARSLDLPSQS
jgi:hypothetical protein